MYASMVVTVGFSHGTTPLVFCSHTSYMCIKSILAIIKSHEGTEAASPHNTMLQHHLVVP